MDQDREHGLSLNKEKSAKLSVNHKKNRTKKARGLKAQPLKDIILGSSPSENRELLTHIITNVLTHPPTDIRVGRLQKAQPMAELNKKR